MTDTPSVNANLRMSVGGLAALQRLEGVALRYYNDIAGNCTYGIGTLAHHGLCTDEELRRPVSQELVGVELRARVRVAEAAVRAGVNRTVLTQAQFDGLVSYVYNMGARGARRVLEAANRGAHQEVSRQIRDAVYFHPRDAQGRRLQPQLSRGLVNRREEEARPFQEPR